MKKRWRVTVERTDPLTLILWRKAPPLALLWAEYKRETLVGPTYWFKSAEQRVEMGTRALLALAARVEAQETAQRAKEQRLGDLCRKLTEGETLP